MATTQVSAGAAGLSWMFTEWIIKGKPTVLSIISGAVAGLVVITPACGFVDMTGAMLMGFIGGIVCLFGVSLKHKLGYDDALDAFGVHGVGGALGGETTCSHPV
jgi:Amt family ammonium transporter